MTPSPAVRTHGLRGVALFVMAIFRVVFAMTGYAAHILTLQDHAVEDFYAIHLNHLAAFSEVTLKSLKKEPHIRTNMFLKIGNLH